MPKKITPVEQAKPTRDEVEKRLATKLGQMNEFLAEVHANKGLTCLDELALKTLVSIERQIPPDTGHVDGIRALECCALAREAKSEMQANCWLREAIASGKDWMLWDDAIKGEKFANKGRGAGKWRKFIAAQLKKNSSAKNAELWAAAKAKNYAGWDFYDSPTKYAMGPDGEIGFARFCNIAAEERGKAEL